MINEEKRFAARLIAWQMAHGRHDLPWQRSDDPYRVWLSEIMLQQTRVVTVLAYFERFLARFPTLPVLARSPLAEVMAAWSGLGYYARARNLHACARVVLDRHGGVLPEAPADLAGLPGIGRSTANAIAAFCHGARVAILDGNVKRVLCRHFGVSGLPGTAAVDRELWRLAESLLPQEAVADYLQAQMDLGATLCARSKPRCGDCPVAASCIARAEAKTALLPQKRQRGALPQRRTRVLLLVDDGRVLLVRRPPVGVWGGLQSLPEVPDGVEASSYAAEVLGCEVALWDELPELRHSFTHFQLTLLPLQGRARTLPRAAEGSPASWVGSGELGNAALPAPIRALLQSFFRISPAPGDAPAPGSAAGSARRAIR